MGVVRASTTYTLTSFLQFGRKAAQSAGTTTLCVNMEGRSLLLHDLEHPTAAIELLFHSRCVRGRQSRMWGHASDPPLMHAVMVP